MLKSMYSAVILSIVGLLLVSCGSNDPASIGKAISKKECECSRENQNRSFSKNMAAQKQLISEVKEGRFKTSREYETRRSELFKDVRGKDDERRSCDEELKKMQQDAELEFVEENDRKTIMNSYRANFRVCEEENTKMHQSNREKIEELEKEHRVIASNLPYR
jgi:hypothetical protein